MLAADKLQLQSALKQQATALKEKEFNLHHSNLMTVGTQAAVLASLDVTMFIEFQPPPNDEWGEHLYFIPRTLKFFYYIMITAAFCANILVVGQTTVLSVLGSALALRGPDGSMVTATDGLYDERMSVFWAFGLGLGTTVGSVIICVWLILNPEASFVCMLVTIFTSIRMYKNYLRVTRRFDFNEDETVDFTDIFEGPAAIRAVPVHSKKSWLSRSKPVGGGKGSPKVKGKRDKVYKDHDDYETQKHNSESEHSLTEEIIPNGTGSHDNRSRRKRITSNSVNTSNWESDFSYDDDQTPQINQYRHRHQLQQQQQNNHSTSNSNQLMTV